MTRKILIILSISFGVLLSGLMIWYLILRNGSSKSGQAIDAVPENAAVIFIVKDPINQLQTVLDQPFWPGLDTVAGISHIRIQKNYVDSLIRNNERTSEITRDIEIVISIHPGKNGAELLFVIPVAPKTPDNFIDQFIQNSNPHRQIEKIKTENGNIRNMQTPSGRISYSISRGLFLYSLDYSLVEASLARLKSGTGWTHDPAFQDIFKTMSPDKKVKTFFRFDLLEKVSRLYRSENHDHSWSLFERFAGWSSGSLNWNAKGFSLVGLTRTDSPDQLLNAFGKLNVPSSNIAGRLPSGSIFYADYAWSENALYPSMDDWSMDVRSRVCMFITENGNGTLHRMALIDYNEIEAKWNGFISDFSVPNSDYAIDNFHALKLQNSEGLLKLPFSIFTDEDTLNVMMMDEYVIVGTSQAALSDYAGKIISGQTLYNQSVYADWNEGISNGQLSFYFRPSAADKIFYELLSPQAIENWNRSRTLSKLISSAGIIFNYRGGSFSVQAKVDISKKLNLGLDVAWELPLQAPAIISPGVLEFKNDTTRLIFVQDSLRMLYCLDHTGLLKWKRPLDDKIMGDFSTVQFYENEPQLLFSTASFVYVIDKDGKNMPGFPLEIPGGSDIPISVINYGGNDGYRIFSVNRDNKLLINDKNGAAVEGWQLDQIQSLLLPIKHLKVGRDLLLFTFLNNGLLITDRQGKEVLALPNALKGRKGIPLLVNNNTLSSSGIVYMAEDGKCRITYFDASKSPDEYSTIPGSSLFGYHDSNQDGTKEFFVSEGKKIIAVDRKGKAIASYSLAVQTPLLPQITQVDKNLLILVTVPAEDKIYFLDRHLQLITGFPVRGSEHSSVISGIGKDKLLITTFESRLLCYILNEI